MKKIRPTMKMLAILEEGYKAIKPMKGWMQGAEAECEDVAGKRRCRYCAIGSVYYDTKTQEHRLGKDGILAVKAVALLDQMTAELYPSKYDDVVTLNDDRSPKASHRRVLKVFRETIARVKEQLGIWS